MGATVLGNRYEILRKIGDGGMAFVYEARDKLLNRTVAVKVLRPEYVDDQEFLVKFKREAEAVASLSHPNIVNVYDVGEDGKVHYIVMEYVDGQNLKEIIQNEGCLEEYTAMDIAKQIALALGAAHRNGIIHRDIKPHNILISKDGRLVKVADFGIAKAVSSSTMTNMGSVIGSVHYISPEQAKGKHLTSNADLYSLGIVMYEMIVGRVPFVGDSPISIALKHVNDNVSFTDEEMVRIPKSVRTIIGKLTEKEPCNRYQTAEELIEDIDYVEKNIDLPYVKDYDNFATTDLERRDPSQFDGRKPEMYKDEDDYDDEYDEYDDYDDEDYDDYDEYDEDEEDSDSPRGRGDIGNDKISDRDLGRKKKKKKKEETPRSRRVLKVLAVILIIILCGYGYVFFKYYVGINPLASITQQQDEVSVPNVLNMTVEQAQSAVSGKGINIVVKSQEYNNDVGEGRIISQTPSPDTKIKKGDSISVVVSKGNSKIPVPSVVGLKLSQAEKLLNDNGLSVGNIKYEYNSADEGTVLFQSIVGGSSDSDQKISLVVSKGKEPSNEKPSIVDDTNNDNSSNSNSNTNTNGTNSNSNSNSSSDDNSLGDFNNTPDDSSTGLGNSDNNSDANSSNSNSNSSSSSSSSSTNSGYGSNQSGTTKKYRYRRKYNSQGSSTQGSSQNGYGTSQGTNGNTNSNGTN